MKARISTFTLAPSYGGKTQWRLEIVPDGIVWRGTSYDYKSARRRMAMLVRGWRKARREWSANHPYTLTVANAYTNAIDPRNAPRA